MSAAASLSNWTIAEEIASRELIDRQPTRRKSHLRPEPAVDWEKGEELFVFGYAAETKIRKRPFWKWPSERDIGKHLGCSSPSVEKYAERHNWYELRWEHQQRVVSLAREANAISQTAPTPTGSSIPGTEPLSIIEAYILRFAAHLEAGKVRLDDVAQFDKAVRLRAYLRGEGERDAGKPQALTLDELQTQHHERRAAERGNDIDDELAGVHTRGSDALEDDAPAHAQGAHVGTRTDTTRKRTYKGRKPKQKQEVATPLESETTETKAPFADDEAIEPDPLALDEEVPTSPP
jgi:hypothetical protein